MPNNVNIDDILDLATIEAGFRKVFALIDELNARIMAVNKLATEFKVPKSPTTPGAGGAAGTGGRNAPQEVDKLAAAQKRLAAAESDLGKQIATVNEKIRQQNTLNAQNARQTIAATGSLNDLRARLAQARTAFDNMSAAERNMGKNAKEAIAQIQALDKEVRELEQSTGRFQRNVGNYPQQFASVASGILGQFGIVTGVAAIGAAAKGIFDTTQQLDSMNTALKNVSKTTEEFNKNQQFLGDLSERLGINIIQTGNAFKGFYAAATQAGISGTDTRKMFEQISEAASTFRLSQDDLNGVLLASQQILSKGTVQAEELRGQIGERLPVAFGIAAKAIGVTEQELNKMLQQGQVISKDFLPKFAAQLQKDFGNGGKEVEGLAQSVERLKNSLSDLVSENQGALTGFFKGIIDWGTAAVNVINGLSQATGYLINLFGNREANRQFIELSAVHDVITKASKLTTDELLKQKTLYNQNAKTAAEQLAIDQRHLDFLKEQAKQPFNQAGFQQAYFKGIIQEQEEAVRKAAFELEKYQKLQAGIGEAIDKRLSPAETAGAEKVTEAQVKKESRLRELSLKAQKDGRIADLQDLAEYLKSRYGNELLSYDDRIDALHRYLDVRNQIITVNLDYDKKIAQENIKQGQATADELTNIEKDAGRERNKALMENLEDAGKITQDDRNKRAALVAADGIRRKQELDKQQVDTEEQIKSLFDKGQLTEEQYRLAIKQTANRYQKLQLEDEINTVQKLLNIRKAAGESTDKEEAQLNDIRLKIRRLDLEDFEKTETQKTAAQKKEYALRVRGAEEMNKRLVELGNELLQFSFSVVDASFEKQKASIDELMQANEERAQTEIDAVNRSAATEEEKQDRIAVINNRAAAEEERLNNRKKQIEVQQARFERAKSIANVIQNTATGVIRTFADFPFYIAAPIAAIIAGIGAAQLATVFSSQLPAYKEGREDGPAEWARVGDGGQHEVIEYAGRAYLTPNRDTVTYLPARAKVHKSVEAFNKSRAQVAITRVPASEAKNVSQNVIFDDSNIVDAINRNKPTFIVKNTWAGVEASMKNASGWINYVNKNIYN